MPGYTFKQLATSQGKLILLWMSIWKILVFLYTTKNLQPTISLNCRKIADCLSNIVWLRNKIVWIFCQNQSINFLRTPRFLLSNLASFIARRYYLCNDLLNFFLFLRFRHSCMILILGTKIHNFCDNPLKRVVNYIFLTSKRQDKIIKSRNNELKKQEVIL